MTGLFEEHDGRFYFRLCTHPSIVIDLRHSSKVQAHEANAEEGRVKEDTIESEGQ